MPRVDIAVLCLAATLGFAAAAGAQTPGQIPDPSSYAGSMALQQQERERAQQVQQQNDAMLQRLDQTYARYAPGGAAAGGGGPPPINWRARPPLPAAKNPLLGRWRQVAARGVTGSQIGSASPLASLLPSDSLDIAASIVNATMAGGCESIFGKGVIAFEPNALQWVAPDGHVEILNHVEYRADGANVVMLSNDPGAVPWLIFGFPSRDHAVVALLNCAMTRVSATTAARPSAAAAASPLAPPSSGPAKSSLSVQVGAAGPGYFNPIGGAVFYVVTHDPDAALVQAGFVGRSPIDAWFAACRTDQERCKAGIRAMTAGAVGNMRTDVAGNAEVPQLPAGRYYLVGHAAYQGKEVVWHRPVVVQPGPNRVVLDQTNGSIGGG
jgi:hypothetical protein